MLSPMVRVQSVEHRLRPNDRQHQVSEKLELPTKKPGRTVSLFVIYCVEFAVRGQSY